MIITLLVFIPRTFKVTLYNQIFANQTEDITLVFNVTSFILRILGKKRLNGRSQNIIILDSCVQITIP